MDINGAWKRISTTVDAAKKLYDYRSDALWKDAITLFQKSTSKMGKIDLNTEDEAEDENLRSKEPIEEDLCAFNNMYKNNNHLTLDQPSNLISNKLENYSFDPLFFKISGEFEGGGYKGLLINNIEVDNDINYIFYNEKLIESKGFNKVKEDIYGSNLMGVKRELSHIKHNINDISLCPKLSEYRSEYFDNETDHCNDNTSVFTIEMEPNSYAEDPEHFMEIEKDYDNILIEEINNIQTPLMTEYEDYPVSVITDELHNTSTYFSADMEIEQSIINNDIGTTPQQVFQDKFDFWNYLEPEMWSMSNFNRKEKNFFTTKG